MLAVLRIRGTAKIKADVKETLDILQLKSPNHCVIIPKTPVYLGMLKKAQGWVAWGDIKTETLEKMIEARGKPIDAKKTDSKSAAKKIMEGKLKESGFSNLFRLSPPKKGFSRRGVLRAFNQGGELGYQKEKINDLIERML